MKGAILLSKKVYIDRIVSVVLLLTWMVFIFVLSNENAGTSANTSGQIIKKIAQAVDRNFTTLPPAQQHSIIENWQSFVRTMAHFTEYIVLGFLAANTVRAFKIKGRLAYGLPVLFGLVYAVSDEIHQIFIPGRSCQFGDIVVDTLGSVIGTFVFLVLAWIVKTIVTCKKQNKNKKLNKIRE